MSNIDPRAIVSPKAELAADVTVGAYSVIGDDVKIGAGTWIGPHAVINGPTTLGAGNRVFQFASIGDAPQDLKYKGEPTRLAIRLAEASGLTLVALLRGTTANVYTHGDRLIP